MSHSNRLEETRAHVLRTLRTIALAASSSGSQSRLDDLDAQLVDVLNGSGYMESDGGHGPAIAITPDGKATRSDDAFRRLAAALGDPTNDLLPVSAEALPEGSVLDQHSAIDPLGRQWRFLPGDERWYMVDPNAVAR